MTDKVFENNQVSIVGEVISEFVYSHEVFGESFYMVELSVNRLSDSNDIIPVMVSGARILCGFLPTYRIRLCRMGYQQNTR